MNDAPTLLVVCDAGPLIHLDQLDCLDLLADFSRVVVPDVVWREVEHHRPTALDQKTIRLERIEPQKEPSAELSSLHRLLALHAGEVQALQLAQELNADLLLTDDTAARLAAKRLQCLRMARSESCYALYGDDNEGRKRFSTCCVRFPLVRRCMSNVNCWMKSFGRWES
jgi:predicted nucleic acid-binding protein